MKCIKYARLILRWMLNRKHSKCPFFCPLHVHILCCMMFVDEFSIFIAFDAPEFARIHTIFMKMFYNEISKHFVVLFSKFSVV